MSDRLCGKCLAWELAGDDAYCGNCGSSCAELALEVIPGILHSGHVAPPIGLKLTNPSCGTLTVRAISLPPWIVIEQRQVLGSVAPKEVRTALARASTLALKQPRADWIEVQTAAGSAQALIMAIAEKPEVTVSPDSIPVWVDPRRRGRQPISVDLAVAEGCLRIVAVSSGLSWLNVTGPAQGPVVIAADKPLRVEIAVDSAAVLAMQTKSGALTIRYESPHGFDTIQPQLRFQVDRAPELRWAGAAQTPPILSQMDKQPVTFVFRNRTEDDPQAGRTNAPVVLNDVVLTAEEGGHELASRRITPLPRRVAGGSECEVAFELNLEAHAPTLHRLRLRITTDCPDVDREFNHKPGGSIATIDVREVKEFIGTIAIDFGTSNTCCAILPSGGAIESICVDSGSSPTTAPTLIRYREISGRYPEIETGAMVKKQAALNADYAASTVDRLKQQLGEATYPLCIRPVSTGRWVFREARAAAGDYLHHIRHSAERAKGVVFRRFILTHPAVCSIRQYRNLRFALTEAFGAGAEVQFLQEPVAALIPFFQSRATDPKERSYTVASFDLGGGTTDITIVRVEQKLAGGAVQISPTIVASWGERFGGENLTDFLVEQVLSKAREVLAVKQPELLLAARGVAGASDPDILGNQAALRDWTEIFKAALSEEPGGRHEPETLILRAISKHPDRPPVLFPFQPEDIGAGNQGDLRQVFEGYCRDRIEAMAARIKRTLAGRLGLTYIHLSGKTTFLPIVKKTLWSIFPVVIERAPDPKECVVRGACLFHAMANSRLRRLVMEHTQRTTSSIGLMDEDTATFVGVIRFDTPLPPGGVVRELPNVWNGRDSLVVWENLGVENARVFPDGSANPDLRKLGTWQPERRADLRNGTWWTVRFTLDAAFALTVAAIGPDGETVRFSSLESGGL